MRRAPLSRRFFQVTLAGGVIVSLVAFFLTVPIVRGVARDQARADLVRAVDALAAKPAATARLLAQEEKVLGPDDRRYAIVRSGGGTTGSAAAVLTADQVETLLATGSLSSTSTVDGVTVLVEGRATKRGFSAVAVQPVAGVEAATAELRSRLLLAVLAGLAVAGALGLVLSRGLARSVAATASAARRLAAGERGVPVGGSSVLEVDEMSRAIESLDQALTASEGRQREFLLSVSHEIRTPLTALRGYAEALADGAVGAGAVRSTGATLVAETQRLDRFVSDLLSLARLDAEDFSIQPVDVPLAGLLADLSTVWQATCEREGITLRVEPGPEIVTADPMRLRQLLDGLVENAVRASSTGGTVVVRGVPAPGRVVVEVEDEGPGLTDDDLGSTFDRGVLHATYRDVRSVGTGLGLSIAHRLATRMGAALEAGRADGGGAVFRLELPETPDRTAARGTPPGGR